MPAMTPENESPAPQPWRVPTWLLVVITVLVLATTALTVEVVRLNRTVVRARCESARATAVAVLAASGRPTPDAVLRALSTSCTGKHQIFDL
ncbi:MAG: hypothetical protein QOF30_849 [Acidimicrobiaceae bacterium]|nr:hypothetical protein [Acidimicrobiaceae bacterium]